MATPVSGLQIGRLLDVPDVPLYLKGPGLTAHTLIVGQSGSGKSFMLGRLLEEIAAKTTARVVILDPNSDFVRFSEVQPKVWLDFPSAFESTDTEESFRKAWGPVSFSLLTSRDHSALALGPAAKVDPPTLSWGPDSVFEAATELGFDTKSNVDEVFALNEVLWGQDQKTIEPFATFVNRAADRSRNPRIAHPDSARTVYARAFEMKNLNVWTQGPGEGSVQASVNTLLAQTSQAGRILSVDLASLEHQDASLDRDEFRP